MFKGFMGGKRKDDWKNNLEALHTRPIHAVPRASHTIYSTEKVSDDEYSIYNAARKGDVKELKFMIKSFPMNINRRDGQGDSALHYAARNGLVTLVEVLLEGQANPNVQNSTGMSPLHEAVLAGSVPVTRRLLDCSADCQLKRLDGASPQDLAAGKPELQELFLKHQTALRNQLSASTRSAQPARARTVLNLLASPYLVQQRSIHFGACSMGSDRHITVTEHSLGKVAVISLGSGNGTDASAVPATVQRFAFAAEGAAMNPEHPILAWKDETAIHLVNITSGKEVKTLKLAALREEVRLWRWVSSDCLALVTASAVLHWHMASAQPSRVFALAPALTDAQLINYQSLADGRCCLVGGVVVRQGRPVEGVMQLFTAGTKESEILHGHCGIFASLTPPGRKGAVDVLIYEDRTSAEHTHLCIREVGRVPAAQDDPFCVSSQPLSAVAPDSNKSDFPVTVTLSPGQGVVYVMSRLGCLTLYDVYTGKTLFHDRVTEECVFCATEHAGSGGILAISRTGQVLDISINRDTFVSHLVQRLGDPVLTLDLARRLGVPEAEAERLCAEHHHRFHCVGDIAKYQINGLKDASGALALSYVSARCKPVVVCVDLGNTYCGVAFTYRKDPRAVTCAAPTVKEALQVRAPASLLLLEDGQWEFGFDAETRYYERMLDCVAEEGNSARASPSVHLFRNLLGALKGRFTGFDEVQGVSLAGTAQRPLLELITEVLRAMRAFVLAKVALSFGTEGGGSAEVQWVLTVPPYWNDFGVAFLRRAAFSAGMISSEQSEGLILVPQSDAAALAVHLAQPEAGLLSQGERFIVVDCGGKSVYITLHEVRGLSPLDISATGPATGGDWGGERVNLEFKKFLKGLLGADRYRALEESDPYLFHTIYQAFDRIKVGFDPSSVPAAIYVGDVLEKKAQLLELAAAFNDKHPRTPVEPTPALRNGFLTMSNALMLSFFDPPLALITREVDRVLAESPCVRSVVLVGGFGTSKVLIERLQGVVEGGKTRAGMGKKVRVVFSENRTTAQTLTAQGGAFWGVYKAITET